MWNLSGNISPDFGSDEHIKAKNCVKAVYLYARRLKALYDGYWWGI